MTFRSRLKTAIDLSKAIAKPLLDLVVKPETRARQQLIRNQKKLHDHLMLVHLEAVRRFKIQQQHMQLLAKMQLSYHQELHRQQIAQQQLQQFALLQFQQQQELARLKIIHKQQQLHTELTHKHRESHADAIVKSLKRLGILLYKQKIKPLPDANKHRILQNLYNYIINLPPCPSWQRERELLYYANHLSGKYCEKTEQRTGLFANYIDHERLTLEYFAKLGIRYVEEYTIPAVKLKPSPVVCPSHVTQISFDSPPDSVCSSGFLPQMPSVCIGQKSTITSTVSSTRSHGSAVSRAVHMPKLQPSTVVSLASTASSGSTGTRAAVQIPRLTPGFHRLTG